MIRLLFIINLLLVASFSNVNAQTVSELQQTAQSFFQTGDFTNAILVLNKAAKDDPNNLEVSKSLALAYYFNKENEKALQIITPLLDRNDADDQCYQIAGSIYVQMSNAKDCEKMYKKGIKKFPESGPLYNELGELLWEQKDFSAIHEWEKGIEKDPSFSGNYYNACKYYYFTTDKVWSIVYGEIFLNMEPEGIKCNEIKTILLESFKKIFTEQDNVKEKKEKNDFSIAFLDCINKQSNLISTGITPETLTMVRSRFILEWFQKNAEQFPFKLFDIERQLLQNGLFDAYNQWLFGSIQNPAAFQNWTKLHEPEYRELTTLMKNRTFKVPTGQYYHSHN